MKYIKAYESLKPLSANELEGLQSGKIANDYMELNETDNNYYKVTEKANNWYYKIKWYYRKPGYKTYCFLKADELGAYSASQFWIEEDKLMITSKEEIEKYLVILNSFKYNL